MSKLFTLELVDVRDTDRPPVLVRECCPFLWRQKRHGPLQPGPRGYMNSSLTTLPFSASLMGRPEGVRKVFAPSMPHADSKVAYRSGTVTGRSATFSPFASEPPIAR